MNLGGGFSACQCRHSTRRRLEEETRMTFGDRITINPQICHGQACVKGTRIPVHQIVRMLANGDTVDDLLTEYPPLTREDIMACLDYAAGLAEEQVTPIELVSG
jgi:uncharacterized protein (DUF433 family)